MATYQNSRYNIALPSGAGGAIVPIKTLTASSSGTLEFVDGTSDVVLDNTYRTYVFKFVNCHPSGSNVHFQVNFRDGGSSYDATKTTTNFHSVHNEADDDAEIGYSTGSDLAQSTAFQLLQQEVGNDNDSSVSGEMWLFNPSSTTYVKHFIATMQASYRAYRSHNTFVGGYCNVTAAIDAVQFKFASGNIDSGTIKLYGIA